MESINPYSGVSTADHIEHERFHTDGGIPLAHPVRDEVFAVFVERRVTNRGIVPAGGVVIESVNADGRVVVGGVVIACLVLAERIKTSSGVGEAAYIFMERTRTRGRVEETACVLQECLEP